MIIGIVNVGLLPLRHSNRNSTREKKLPRGWDKKDLVRLNTKPVFANLHANILLLPRAPLCFTTVVKTTHVETIEKGGQDYKPPI